MAQDTYTVLIYTSAKNVDGFVTTDEKAARRFAAKYAHDPKWSGHSGRHVFTAGPVEV